MYATNYAARQCDITIPVDLLAKDWVVRAAREPGVVVTFNGCEVVSLLGVMELNEDKELVRVKDIKWEGAGSSALHDELLELVMKSKGALELVVMWDTGILSHILCHNGNITMSEGAAEEGVKP